MAKRPIIMHDSDARLTVGLFVDDDGMLWFASSFCHKKDQFTKKKGFSKVMGRLKGNLTVPVDNALSEPAPGKGPCGQWCKVQVGQFFGTNLYEDVLEPIKRTLSSMCPESRRNAKTTYRTLIQAVSEVVNGRRD